jgi:hypothetical protein
VLRGAGEQETGLLSLQRLRRRGQAYENRTAGGQPWCMGLVPGWWCLRYRC